MAPLSLVAQCRPLVGTHLALTVQLAEQDNGNIQLLGYQLCLAARFRHFLLTVAVLLFRLHIAELQIVDNQQVAMPLALLQQR